eukprot:scaffold55163_cov39-Tisochrysis_lutea.AAC.2
MTTNLSAGSVALIIISALIGFVSIAGLVVVYLHWKRDSILVSRYKSRPLTDSGAEALSKSSAGAAGEANGGASSSNSG